MKRKTIYTMLTVLCILTFSVFAQEPTKTATINTEFKKWTGDLDGMVQRRAIRVLVAYNKTNYFRDREVQRGVAYDAMNIFAADLNKKMNLGHLKLHVIFIPVSRDEIFPGLIEGRGDVAIANLTITPERLKLVDFTEPVYKNSSEIVVTGPGAPAIKTVDDLAGQQVFVRKSSSFYEGLVALNQRFKKEGKKEVILKLAPENLETEDFIEMANAGLIKIIIADEPMAKFWKQVFPNITLHPEAAIRTNADFAWAIRKNSPQLKAELDAFIKTHGKGTQFGNMTLQKYFKSVKFVKNATSEAERKKFLELITFFRKYSDQ